MGYLVNLVSYVWSPYQIPQTQTQ